MKDTEQIELNEVELRGVCGGQMWGDPAAEIQAGYDACDRQLGPKGSWPNRTMHAGCIAQMNYTYGGWSTMDANGNVVFDNRKHLDANGRAVMGPAGT